MKLTKSKLKEIIREEIQKLNEDRGWKIINTGQRTLNKSVTSLDSNKSSVIDNI